MSVFSGSNIGETNENISILHSLVKPRKEATNELFNKNIISILKNDKTQ